MAYYIKIENGAPVGPPYPHEIDGGVPLISIKPEYNPLFEVRTLESEVYDGTNVTRTYVKAWKTFPVVLAEMSIALDKLRRETLDKFQRKSVGVSRVYAENLKAAELFLGGNGTFVMGTGSTAEAYLTALGGPLGMNATQFANYIVYENQRLTPNALEVEKRYLQVKAALLSGSVPAVASAWYVFHGYCLTVPTE